SRGQGNGDRPLLSAQFELARGVDPLPRSRRQVPDDQPRARGALPPDRMLSRARYSGRSEEVGGGARRQLSGQRMVRTRLQADAEARAERVIAPGIDSAFVLR